MSIFSSYKKIFLLGFIIIILLAIPFSVYIAQQRQRTTSQAAKSTTLSFEPASPTTKVGDTLPLSVVLDPGSGSTANQVSFVKLSISFDPEKFTTAGASLVPNPSSSNTLISILEDPIFEAGKASISLSIGADPTRVVTKKTDIAILKLKSLSTTDANNPSSITFDATETQVLSIASSDQTSENVLSTTTPATVTINQQSSAPGTSPTPTPTPTTAPSVSAGKAPAQTGGTTGRATEETIQLSTGSAVFNPAPVFETEPSPIVLLPQEPLPPTGPGEKILGIGIIGVILTLIGGALFLLL